MKMKRYIYTIFLGGEEASGYIEAITIPHAALAAAKGVGIKDPVLSSDGAFPAGSYAFGHRVDGKLVHLGTIFVREAP